MVERALSIATSFHRGQVDKSGEPYILHCIRVGMQFPEDETLMSIGFLHDIVEDCAITVKDLNEKFRANVSRTVGILTKGKREPYSEYIERISQDRLATLVKLADLGDNMDLSRLAHPTPQDFDRYLKYRESYRILGAIRHAKE